MELKQWEMLMSSLMLCTSLWPTGIHAYDDKGQSDYQVVKAVKPYPSTKEPAYLYRQSKFAPHEIAEMGGFIPQTPREPRDEAFGYCTFGDDGGPWVLLLSWEVIDLVLRRGEEEEDAGATYLYEIATSPNMVLTREAWREVLSAWAFGRVLLSQVRRVAHREAGVEFSELVWEMNPFFDARWDGMHTSGWQPQLAGFLYDHPVWGEEAGEEAGWAYAPSSGMSRRQQAMLFMHDMMRNETVRNMLRWTREMPLYSADDGGVTVFGESEFRVFPWDTVDVPDEVQRSLAAGRVTEQQCETVVTAIERSFWARHLAAGWERDGVCARLYRAAKRLRSLETGSLVSAAAPKHCREFSRVKVYFELMNNVSAGTDDLIYLDLPVYRRALIARRPRKGHSRWQELPLKTLFGKERVAVNKLYYMELSSQATTAYPFDADDWKLQGLKIRGKCADSMRGLELDKFASVQGWFGRPAGTEMATVWSGTVAVGEWRDFALTPAGCRFDSLVVTVRLGDSWVAGSWDDVVLHWGNGSTTVVVEPTRLEFKAAFVDIKTAFGGDTVSVYEMGRFVLTTAPRTVYTGDWVQIQDLYFAARCVGSRRWASNFRHEGIKKWLNHFNDFNFRYTRTLQPQDWKWLDKDGGDF